MYYRKIGDTKKKEKIYAAQASGRRYFPSGVYFDKRKNRFVQYWRGSESRYFKRKCNRKLRHQNVSDHGNYKKHNEFKWEID